MILPPSLCSKPNGDVGRPSDQYSVVPFRMNSLTGTGRAAIISHVGVGSLPIRGMRLQPLPRGLLPPGTGRTAAPPTSMVTPGRLGTGAGPVGSGRAMLPPGTEGKFQGIVPTGPGIGARTAVGTLSSVEFQPPVALTAPKSAGTARRVQVGHQDLANMWQKYGLALDQDTLAVARTDVSGLERYTFEGASRTIRATAAVPQSTQ